MRSRRVFMKDTTKKVLVKCGEVLLFLVVAGVCLGGFFYHLFKREEVPVYENGYFQYIILGEHPFSPTASADNLAIVGLTEEGLKQENLAIPRKIDGRTVEYIGFDDHNSLYDYNYDFYAENLKKLYIYENVKEIVNLDYDGVDLVVCADTYDVILTFSPVDNIYLNRELYNSSTYSEEIKPANVSFMNNYENGGYYLVDNCDYGSIIGFVPPEPTREGYTFGGWYKEPECINKWDFETDTLPEQIFDEEGKEIYQETKLYAKWLSNS